MMWSLYDSHGFDAKNICMKKYLSIIQQSMNKKDEEKENKLFDAVLTRHFFRAYKTKDWRRERNQNIDWTVIKSYFVTIKPSGVKPGIEFGHVPCLTYMAF